MSSLKAWVIKDFRTKMYSSYGCRKKVNISKLTLIHLITIGKWDFWNWKHRFFIWTFKWVAKCPFLYSATNSVCCAKGTKARKHCDICHRRELETIDRTYNKQFSQNFWLNRKVSIETLIGKKTSLFLVFETLDVQIFTFLI